MSDQKTFTLWQARIAVVELKNDLVADHTFIPYSVNTTAIKTFENIIIKINQVIFENDEDDELSEVNSYEGTELICEAEEKTVLNSKVAVNTE
ncbi:hypothetical protein ACIDE9_10455 [Methylophilus sp. 'Pure River']|uniref:hypothetical protein n=1 Tax=Methylophilus sp. 'Pure River' TaxID=3377117 RepID=UPI00398E88FC